MAINLTYLTDTRLRQDSFSPPPLRCPVRCSSQGRRRATLLLIFLARNHLSSRNLLSSSSASRGSAAGPSIRLARLHLSASFMSTSSAQEEEPHNRRRSASELQVLQSGHPDVGNPIGYWQTRKLGKMGHHACHLLQAQRKHVVPDAGLAWAIDFAWTLPELDDVGMEVVHVGQEACDRTLGAS